MLINSTYNLFQNYLENSQDQIILICNKRSSQLVTSTNKEELI